MVVAFIYTVRWQLDFSVSVLDRGPPWPESFNLVDQRRSTFVRLRPSPSSLHPRSSPPLDAGVESSHERRMFDYLICLQNRSIDSSVPANLDVVAMVALTLLLNFSFAHSLQVCNLDSISIVIFGGVDIYIGCRNAVVGNENTYETHGRSDKDGFFKIPLDGHRGNDICELLPLNYPRANCKEPINEKPTTVNIDKSEFYSIGYMIDKPLDQCKQILKENKLTVNDYLYGPGD